MTHSIQFWAQMRTPEPRVIVRFPIFANNKQQQAKAADTAKKKPKRPTASTTTTNIPSPEATMVRVFYEPPPGGPRSNLNRGGHYYESSMMPTFLKKWSKARPMIGIGAPVIGIIMLCYVPLSKYLFPNEVPPLDANYIYF
jgi:hypothetical protein